MMFMARLISSAIAVVGMVGAAHAAQTVVWSNNAGTPLVQSFNTTTGARIDNFNGGGSNGRGVVVVGDIVYTTEASAPTVRRFNRNTGALIGSCNIAGVNGGISTIGFDGDAFWTSDYTGANKAYRIDTNCNVIKTVTLSLSQGFYDGLEFFNGKLIANRFDGGLRGGNQYSVYDTDGNLLQANFIDTTGHGNGTGIAFDGTDFYISDIFNNRLTIWDGTTGAFKGALNLLNSANVIEDLSFDYQARVDTCRINCGGGTVPEPGSQPLVAMSLLGLALIMARRKVR